MTPFHILMDMCPLPGNSHNLIDELDATPGLPGNDNQVFIVRIRAVRREIQGAARIWRGEIEHLNTGRKAFLKALGEIILFIHPILREMGLETTDSGAGAPSWLARIRTSLARKLQMQKPASRPDKKRRRLRSNKN